MTITFYATVDSGSVRPYMPANVPVLLPASSWARLRSSDDKPLPIPKLPDHVTMRAADSGGFVATMRAKRLGLADGYTYTPAQYVAWLRAWGPSWAATMDYCCEPEITGQNDGVVRDRQRRTTEMAHLFWREYKREPWCWVPTIQGWDIGDYVRHARELAPLIAEMAEYYGSGSEFRVGVGTLCRRASVAMIRAVAASVAAELPGIPLHLWGIKLGALRSPAALPSAVVSVDSAAWDGMAGSRDRYEYEAYRDAGQGSQAQFALQVGLPRYLAKVGAALDETKQLTLM